MSMYQTSAREAETPDGPGPLPRARIRARSNVVALGNSGIPASRWPNGNASPGRGGADLSSGFTLVELLVVIAILGILASLLLPSLSSAKRRALSTQCISNLRAMGQGVLVYSGDHDDRLPFAWYDDPRPKENSFYALLYPQFFGTGFDGYRDFETTVFLCPARMREPLPKNHPVRVSYAMNANTALEFPKPETRRLAVVEAGAPASTVLIADVFHAYNHPPLRAFDATQVGFRHDRRANVQYFDGHSEPSAENQTNRLSLDL